MEPVRPGSVAALALRGLLAGEPVVTIRADLGDDPYLALAHVLAYLAPRCPEDAIVSMMVNEPADQTRMVALIAEQAAAVTRMEVEAFHSTFLNFWPSDRHCLSLEVWSPNAPDPNGPLLMSHLLVVDPSNLPRSRWSTFVAAGQLLLVGSSEDPAPGPGLEGLGMIAPSIRADWGEVPFELLLAAVE